MLAPYADIRILEIFTKEMVQRGIAVRNPVSPRRGVFRRLANAVAIWWRARKIEAELDVLSNHMLEDIGIDRGNIHTVAHKWASHEAHPANDDYISKVA